MRYLLVCSLLIHSFLATAQEFHPILANFTVIQFGNEVKVDFGIRGGEFCKGAILQRSVDESIYLDLEVIPGICGGTEFTEHYQLSDNEPLPYQRVFYRLWLGGVGPSEPIEFRYIPLVEGVAVFPNPATESIRVRLDNPSGLPHTADVFDLQGKRVFRSSAQRGNEFLINLSDWSSGTYTFTLQAPGLPERRGKFVVYSLND